MSASLDLVDPDFGVVRLCSRCRETWPKDEEFWYFRQTGPDKGKVMGWCRACWSERRSKKVAS